jgi:DnaJ-class molecular chaperone
MDKIETTEITMCYRCNGKGKETVTPTAVGGESERTCSLCNGSGLLKRIIIYEPFDPKSNG